MELQIAYPSQLLICLLQRTILITGVVTRVSSQNGMVSIPLEAPRSIFLWNRVTSRRVASILGNAYLQLFPNYDEVQLVSIAILLKPELRVTFGSRL